MHDLHYATVANPRHAITVATWKEGDDLKYRMRMDGRVLDEGSLGPAPTECDEGDE
jgi:hypothetical protein